MAFRWDLKDAAESIEQRLGLSEFQTDGTETEKTRDAELEFTDGLSDRVMFLVLGQISQPRAQGFIPNDEVK